VFRFGERKVKQLRSGTVVVGKRLRPSALNLYFSNDSTLSIMQNAEQAFAPVKFDCSIA
jgi:hypothetical protein